MYLSILGAHALPHSWTSSVVIPIAKPGKDPTKPSSYRPIALTSVACKIFERMVNLRLVYHLESRSLISSCQFGFRKNTSTLAPLLKLATYIQDSFIQRKHVIGVFFDLEKAYDTTWRKGILVELFNLGLRGSLPSFIKSFLFDRTLKVRVGTHHSASRQQEEGVPQGSVLSVMLFLIYINSIVDFIHRSEPSIMCSLYADDLAIYFSSPDPVYAAHKIQRAVDLACDWADLHGYRFPSAISYNRRCYIN